MSDPKEHANEFVADLIDAIGEGALDTDEGYVSIIDSVLAYRNDVLSEAQDEIKNLGEDIGDASMMIE